jgi:chromosome partitioning protein
MIDGRTVMEVDPNGKSAAEIVALWNYVSERLEKNFRRTVFAVPASNSAMPMAGAARPMGGGFGRRVIGS